MYDGFIRYVLVFGKFCGEYGLVIFFFFGEYLYLEFIIRIGRMGLVNDFYDFSVDYKFNRRGFNVFFFFR